MKNQRTINNNQFSRIKVVILFAITAYTTSFLLSCEKALKLFSVEINNPFNFDVILDSTFGLDVECSYGSDNKDCIISPNETRIFMADEPTATISLNIIKYQRERDWIPSDDVGRLNFVGTPGETYKWTVGFDNPVYDSKGKNVLDTGTSGGNNGGNSGGNNGGNNENTGQVVFYSQANINECNSVEVVVFKTLEEYFGTATTPPGGGVMGRKTFTGVFPNQEATCSSSNAAVFTLPAGRYYYEHVTNNCTIGHTNKYSWVELNVVKGECTKVRLTR